MKVAIYCRLSEEDRNKLSATDDSESIQNQKSMLIEYAVEKHWSIYNTYSDDDYTGADRSRPAFLQLLKDAEARKFDIVLCKTQSRFTRELELVEKYIHTLFPLWGIRFVSIVDHADTEVKGNKKARQINGLINEWYLEDMSDNIKSVLTNRRKNGFHIGAFALYGYLKDPQRKGHLIIDEEAAEVVREVFTLFSKGYGKTAIARMLNDRGIPNPTEYKRQKGLRYSLPPSKNSTLWKYSAIADMLENEIYRGNLVQGKYGSISFKTKVNKPRGRDHWIIVKGTHEPIIDADLWDTVQCLLKEKAKPFIVGIVGPFAGKVRCLHCGYVLRSSKSHNKHYLKCGTRYTSRDSCIGSFIPVEALEKTVLKELRGIFQEYLDEDAVSRQVHLQSNLEETKEKLKADLEAYRKKQAEYAAAIKNLYLDKTRGVITEEVFLELYQELSKDHERLEHLLLDTEKKVEETERKAQRVTQEYRQEIVKEYTNITKLNREIVVRLIDYITVGKKNPATKEVPIEIHWNF